MADTYFTIIIPAYNEAEHIRRCIESLKTNDNKKIKYEIIVVDNGSTDGTVEIVRELGIRIIENTEGQRKSIGTLRNIGARVSRSDILAFLDADIIVPDNLLQIAQKYFCDGFKGALGFIVNVPSSAGWVGRIWGNPLRLNRDKVINVDFLTGRNIFINRDVFERIQGFNEILITGEDKDLTFRVLRAGFRAISVPDVAVVHLGYDKSLWVFLKKEFWRQGSSLQLAKQWGFSFRTLRNPILSCWHILLLFMIILSILYSNIPFTLSLIFIWIFPSAFLTFSTVGLKRPFIFLLSLFFLTFLRWNISGLALFVQLLRGIPFRNG